MYIDTSLRADGDVVAPVDLEFSNAPVTITSITRSNRTKQDENVLAGCSLLYHQYSAKFDCMKPQNSERLK